MRAVLALSALLIASCQIPTYRWEKPGATSEDFNLQAYECDRDASQGRFGNDWWAQVDAENFAEYCMKAHGWSKVSAGR